MQVSGGHLLGPGLDGAHSLQFFPIGEELAPKPIIHLPIRLGYFLWGG